MASSRRRPGSRFLLPYVLNQSWIPAFAGMTPMQETVAAHTFFARSRSLNFWILPVLVFGSSVNTTCFGAL